MQPSKERLFQAVFNGEIRSLQRMLDSGIDVNVRDSFCRTPLICATSIHEEDVRDLVVRLLLKKGADVNAQDDHGRTTLIESCGTLHKDNVVRRLLRTNRCDVNIADHSGSTALLHAVAADNLCALQTLVNSSGSKKTLRVNDLDIRGVSPLELAMKLKQTKCVQLLVNDAKADISHVTSSTLLDELLQPDESADDVAPRVDYLSRRRKSKPVPQCNMLPITELNLDSPEQLQRLSLCPQCPSQRLNPMLQAEVKSLNNSPKESLA